MKKTIVSVLLSLSVMASVASVEACKLPTKYVSTNHITRNMITARKDKYQLVEVSKGICTTQKRDGRIVNGDQHYNYISYRGVKGCHKGDTVKTYIYYDSNCTYCDCIIRRVDIVSCKHNHKKVITDRKWYDEACK